MCGMAGLREYLGDAMDANSIVLEVESMPSFNDLENEVQDPRMFYAFVRDVWDAAYSHGVHDAMVNEGLTLKEIVESGE